MNTKFTEGPWYISKPKGEHRAFVLANGCNLRVATVAYNSGKCHVNSNAALIAAAPDLYEALAAMRDFMAYKCGDDDQFVLSADKALVKARGEL